MCHLFLAHVEDILIYHSASRGPKVTRLRDTLAKYDKFEAVEVPEISSGDFTETLKGADL